jgi:hypothetical protein
MLVQGKRGFLRLEVSWEVVKVLIYFTSSSSDLEGLTMHTLSSYAVFFIYIITIISQHALRLEATSIVGTRSCSSLF